MKSLIHFVMSALSINALVAADEVTLPEEKLSTYDVVWSSPSKDWNGTMPLGNGDIGLNLLVNTQGEIEFYLSKGDAWDDLGRLVKLGKGRLSLDPTPNMDAGFSQQLSLIDGSIKLRLGQQTIRVWIDANAPVLRFDIESAKPSTAKLEIELWRNEPYEQQWVGWSDLYHQNTLGVTPMVQADTIVPGLDDRLCWYHHNKQSPWETILKTQGLEDIQKLGYEDPLLNRVFGVMAGGSNFKATGELRLESVQASTQQSLELVAQTQHPSSPDQWRESLNKTFTQVQATNRKQAWSDHQQWWRAFWNRSWIFIDGTKDAREITRGYILQRFMLAAAGRSDQPAKFNGSLFTVPFENDPDYRRWGPGYWHQNTRLLYWPMLAAGDFDLMEPFFRMYMDALPLAEYRTRKYFGHEGAYMPECMHFWGLEFADVWGWTPLSERPNREDRLSEVEYLTYHRQGGLETATMMFEYAAYTGNRNFLREVALPFAHSIVTFYVEHYSRDTEGQIEIYPSHALETWWDARNPMPKVAGLHRVVEELLQLPKEMTTSEQRTLWKKWQSELPEYPYTEIADKRAIAPAEFFDSKHNAEAPELYAVFPYEQFGRSRDTDLEAAIVAFNNRLNRQSFGWPQDEIWAADLGLANDARNSLARRAANYHMDKSPSVSRFPAFWGPNYDWTPDQDHGCILMIAVQRMLLNHIDGKGPLLLPAWPKEWDVDFKLHTPGPGVVQGVVKNGKLEHWQTTPTSLAKASTTFDPQQTVLRGAGNLRTDEIPEGYERVARDDLGVLGKQPNLVQGKDFTMNIGAEESLRTIAFDPERIVLRYTNLNPEAAYGLRLVVASDGARSMRFEIDGQAIGETIAVGAGQHQDIFLKVPAELYRDGKLEVATVNVSGPNTVLSLAELYRKGSPAATDGDAIREWRVLYRDDAGTEGAAPNFKNGQPFTMPARITSDSALRTVLYDPAELKLSYTSLDPAKRYRLKVSYTNDGTREQSLYAGQTKLDQRKLKSNAVDTFTAELPKGAIINGQLELKFVNELNGGNVVVALVELEVL